MSGSPSPKDPFEPPQVAGRRRKRSDTPPIAASAAPAVPATILEESSQRRQAAQQRGTPIQTGAGIQAPPYPSAYSSTQSFGYGPPGPTHPGPAPSAFDPRYGHERASPKATRKTKAHVASACVNCKKKHLRCDSARPCRRCVQAGKESACVDVEHKKRGRPPLKAEEGSSRRSFDTAQTPLQGPPAGSSRQLPPAEPAAYSQQQQSNFQRDIRPSPSGDLGRPSFGRPGAPFQSMYAPPSLSHTHATAAGQIIGPGTHISSGPSTISSQALSAYAMTPSNTRRSIGSEQSPRSSNPYAEIYRRPQSQQSIFAPGQAGYRYPPYPPTTTQPEQSHLQLPPILQAPPGVFIEPAMAQAQQQQQSREEQLGATGTMRRPDPKRPRMDIQGILGPRRD